ncbi:excisionase family DNA-binding protein [Rhizohabitans arisaemae]|uniref:excisionase family DNA-binding protein n=1 Tax=Rhizohabitans arisaemae TaxID=2720610 RepID=UPI0024B20077|nr:excisionase family DNA-binding protein [Rhizohabitans arisaemae]
MTVRDLPADSSDDPLLTVDQVAQRLNTSTRFPRRLIQQRRIEFVKVGRHVRIRTSVLDAYITEHSVEPLTYDNVMRKAA